MRFAGRALLVLGLAAGSVPAGAQTSGGTDVPDRFRLEGGYFRVGSQTTLRLGAAASDVAFEREFGFPSTTDQLYGEFSWRLGRRHQLSVGYTRIQRKGESVTLEREISWGDRVFPVGVTATGRTDSDYVSGVYRFALVKNDRVELGPALGVGHIWIKARVTGQARLGGDGGLTSQPIEQTGEVSEITGSLGGYLNAWLGRRVQLRGDARYIAVSAGDIDASVTEARAGLVWYAWRQVGIGAQYQYVKLGYERSLLSSALGGTYRWDGIQGIVSIAF